MLQYFSPAVFRNRPLSSRVMVAIRPTCSAETITPDTVNDHASPSRVYCARQVDSLINEMLIKKEIEIIFPKVQGRAVFLLI